MLRRHTTQSSSDAGVSDPDAMGGGEWTWKMLPAHVRRPQLQFEKGLPDTDDEGREKGRRANEGDSDGKGERRGSSDKENKGEAKVHEKRRKESQ